MKVEGEGQERDCSPKQGQGIKLKEMRKGVCVGGGGGVVCGIQAFRFHIFVTIVF